MPWNKELSWALLLNKFRRAGAVFNGVVNESKPSFTINPNFTFLHYNPIYNNFSELLNIYFQFINHRCRSYRRSWGNQATPHTLAMSWYSYEDFDQQPTVVVVRLFSFVFWLDWISCFFAFVVVPRKVYNTYNLHCMIHAAILQFLMTMWLLGYNNN